MFESIAEASPNCAEAWVLYGRSAMMIKDYLRAFNAYNNAIRISSKA
jgi:cytochrome c-type biogenesis protein CcmH/NrfG